MRRGIGSVRVITRDPSGDGTFRWEDHGRLFVGGYASHAGEPASVSELSRVRQYFKYVGISINKNWPLFPVGLSLAFDYERWRSLGFLCPWGYILPESLTNVEKQRNFYLPVLSFPWHAERCRYNRIRILWRKGGNCVLKTLDSWVPVNGSNFSWSFILCLQEIQSCCQADDRVLHKLMLWGEKKYSSHLYWLRW